MPAHSDSAYCDALLKLQVFCEKHELSFRQEMIRIILARLSGEGSIPPPSPDAPEEPDERRKKISEESRENIRQSALARWKRRREHAP